MNFLWTTDTVILKYFTSFHMTSFSLKIFAKDKVRYAGQPLGLVVAENRYAAFEGIKKVQVMYDNIQPPVIDIADSIARAEKLGKMDELLLTACKSPVNDSLKDVTQTIKGEFRTGGQYHFHMETQTCICIPKEDGMDVFSATQFMDNVQVAVAAALGMTNNRFKNHFENKK